MSSHQSMRINAFGSVARVTIPKEDKALLYEFREWKKAEILNDCLRNPKKYLQEAEE